MRTTTIVILALFGASRAWCGELAYSRLTDGFWQLWVYDEDRGHIQVTEGSSDKRRPRWIGTTGLLYRTNDGELHKVELGSPSQPLLPAVWPALDPTWSPSSRSVAFARLRTDLRDASIVVIAGSGSAPLRVLPLEPGFYAEPSWSPDGTWLAVVRVRGYEGADILRVAVEGRGEEILVSGKAQNTSPVVAPEGTQIAYASNTTGDFEIWTSTLEGEVKQLTRSPGFDGSPAYRPDSSRITFVTQRRGPLEIWEMGPEGQDAAPLFTIDSDVADPAWKPAP